MKTMFTAAILASLFAIAPAAQAEPGVEKPADVAATAASTTSDSAPVATATPKKRAKNTLYCYDMESTGSRIATRSCRTRADWKLVGVNVPSNL